MSRQFMFNARKVSECPVCHKQINIGDLVNIDDGDDVHADCT